MLQRNIKDVNYLHFLAGFVEGEGSMSLAVSVNKKFKYGINIQPIFNVTQHKNGLDILKSFKELFEGGSIVEKSGSPDIYVYTIKGYKNLIKSLPFLETYVCPFSCKMKEFFIFKQVVLALSEGKQKDKESLIELVKLTYTLSGKGKNRKRSLSEIIKIIEDKTSSFDKSKTTLSDNGDENIESLLFANSLNDDVWRQEYEYMIECINKED